MAKYGDKTFFRRANTRWKNCLAEVTMPIMPFIDKKGIHESESLLETNI